LEQFLTGILRKNSDRSVLRQGKFRKAGCSVCQIGQIGVWI